jgi:hypothetical protein
VANGSEDGHVCVANGTAVVRHTQRRLNGGWWTDELRFGWHADVFVQELLALLPTSSLRSLHELVHNKAQSIVHVETDSLQSTC